MVDHTHKFEDLKLYKITKVHHAYNGTAGDKSFMTKACECGKVKAIDYGPTKQMQKRFKELTNDSSNHIGTDSPQHNAGRSVATSE